MSPTANLDHLDAEPIFVGGHVRSGTTWVYDLLTSHELVAGIFESWLFSPLHGIGGVFAPEQWEPVALARQREAVGRPYGIHQLLTREEVAAEIRRLLEGWMARAVEPHHRFLVEKTPAHLKGMAMISEVFPGARFIHVVRDGRDVVVSLRAAARSWGPGLGAGAGRFVHRAAREWRHEVAEISRAGAQVGDRYMEVRYEDLHRQPGRELDRILSFCEIPHDPGEVDAIIDMNRFDQRFAPSEDSFRRAGRVGDWRSRLGRFDALAFDRAAGEMLIAKGYETDRRWWLRPRFGPQQRVAQREGDPRPAQDRR